MAPLLTLLLRADDPENRPSTLGSPRCLVPGQPPSPPPPGSWSVWSWRQFYPKSGINLGHGALSLAAHCPHLEATLLPR